MSHETLVIPLLLQPSHASRVPASLPSPSRCSREPPIVVTPTPLYPPTSHPHYHLLLPSLHHPNPSHSLLQSIPSPLVSRVAALHPSHSRPPSRSSTSFLRRIAALPHLMLSARISCSTSPNSRAAPCFAATTSAVSHCKPITTQLLWQHPSAVTIFPPPRQPRPPSNRCKFSSSLLHLTQAPQPTSASSSVACTPPPPLSYSLSLSRISLSLSLFSFPFWISVDPYPLHLNLNLNHL